jgi:hypothetical protein
VNKGKIFDDPENQKKFDDLYTRGKIDKVIAKEIPCSEYTVGEHRRSQGLSPHGGSGQGGYRVNDTTRAGKKPTPGKQLPPLEKAYSLIKQALRIIREERRGK